MRIIITENAITSKGMVYRFFDQDNPGILGNWIGWQDLRKFIPVNDFNIYIESGKVLNVPDLIKDFVYAGDYKKI